MMGGLGARATRAGALALGILLAGCPPSPRGEEDTKKPKPDAVVDTALVPEPAPELGPEQGAELDVPTPPLDVFEVKEIKDEPDAFHCIADWQCTGKVTLASAKCEVAKCTLATGVCEAVWTAGCCEKKEDCDGALSTVCQEWACTANKCVEAAKPGCCLTAGDCAAMGNGDGCCLEAVCDTATHACSAKTLADCCSFTKENYPYTCDDGAQTTTDVCTAECEEGGCQHLPTCTVNKVFSAKDFNDGTLQLLKLTDTDPSDKISWFHSDYATVSPPWSIHLGHASCPNPGTGAGYYAGPLNPDCTPVDPFQQATTKPVDAKLELQEIPLGNDASAFLGFWVRMSAEAAYVDPDFGQIDFDWLEVRATAGAATKVVWKSTAEYAFGPSNTTSGQWRYQVVDLNEFLGESVVLAFRFTAEKDGNWGVAGAGPYEGVYLDDITVRATCASEACSAQSPCVEDYSGCKASTCSTYPTGGGICAGQTATPGAACKGCVKDADCGTDSCFDYDCKADYTCDIDLKASCCAPYTSFPTKTAAPAVDYESFETPATLASWTHDDPYPSDGVKWQIDGTKGFDAGGSSLYFGDLATSTYDAGPNPAVSTIWTKEVAVDASSQPPVLSFWLWLSTEYDGTAGPAAGENYDTLTVQVLPKYASAPEEAWSSKTAHKNTTDGTWKQVGVDLSKWAGQKVQVGLKFDSGSAFGNQHGGAWVDELALIYFCVPQGKTTVECLAEPTCNKGNACADYACEYGTCKTDLTPAPECCTKDSECKALLKNTCQVASCDLATKTCDFGYNGDPGFLVGCCWDGEEKENPGTVLGWVGEYVTTFDQDLDGWTIEYWDPATSTFKTQPSSYSVAWSWGAAMGRNDTGGVRFYSPQTETYFDPGSSAAVPKGRLTSPPILVPPYKANHFVEFWYALDTEWSEADPAEFDLLGDGFVIDELRVFVIEDGSSVGNKKPRWRSHHVGNTTFGAFVRDRVVLSYLDKNDANWGDALYWDTTESYMGKTVRLVFEFNAGSFDLNSYGGAWLDDITFGSECANVGCVWSNPKTCKTDDHCLYPWCDDDFACGTGFKEGAENCCTPSIQTDWSMTFTPADAAAEWSITTCTPGSGTPVVDPTAVWQVDKSANLPGVGCLLGSNDRGLYFGNKSDYGGALNAAACGVATGPPVALEAGVPWTVRLDLFVDTEPYSDAEACVNEGAEWTDELEIFVVKENGLAELIFQNGQLGCNDYKTCLGEEKKLALDLTAYAGQTIRLRFVFDSFDTLVNSGRGILVDDIEFERGCPP